MPFLFFPYLVCSQLYEEGKFPVDKILKTFAMEEFDQAVHAMYASIAVSHSIFVPISHPALSRRHSGEVIKPIIVFT
jgi:hypothetical protein